MLTYSETLLDNENISYEELLDRWADSDVNNTFQSPADWAYPNSINNNPRDNVVSGPLTAR